MGDHEHVTGLSLEPIDTLFFRDGRPFVPASRASSGTPAPQTVAGAIRTWLMAQADCDFNQLAADVRAGGTIAEAAHNQSTAVSDAIEVRIHGPWFAVNGEPVVPAPANLRIASGDGAVVRLDPLRDSLPGWQPRLAAMIPLWLRGRQILGPVDGYINLAGLERFLAGGVPLREHLVSPLELYDFDHRTGIGVDQGALTAEEGMIYAVSLLALRRGVSLYVELVHPRPLHIADGDTAGVLKVGGEGRYARVRRLARPIDWPGAEPTSDSGGALLLLTTPGLFDGGWRPSWLEPLAAAVPGYRVVSGWDLARGGPKPTRFAAEAGSVYFLRSPIDPLPAPRSLSARQDAADGWGTFVKGVWAHA